MTAISAVELERFRIALGRRAGLQFDDSKLELLAEVLARRAMAYQRSTTGYLDELEVDDSQELRALAVELTTPETYFYRNSEQFHAFAEVALPQRMRARSDCRALNILSAGCASGEEPYTVARVVREHIAEPGWNVSIRGVDINAAMLEKAARARYTAWALREASAETQQRWFSRDGRELVLDERIANAVAFEERNLAAVDPQLWPAGHYDVVFCRNVMMYFTPEAMLALVTRISQALAPGGFLFLGHAETLRGLSSDFHLHHTHHTFYYQRKDELSVAAAPSLVAPPSSAAIAAVAPPIGGSWTTTWVETVQRASDRIHALSTPLSPGASGADPVRPRFDLADTLDLLGQERFADALEQLGELPHAASTDRDVLLLRAVLLTHTGQLAAAAQVCDELVQLDELNAGAHYVLALCKDGTGDRRGAIDHDQVAIYLDQGFAMPHLHLGLMARRSGELDTARRELGQAIVLLQREDPARLLMFGGGFGRDALISLCRTELIAAGGRP
ncbi:MAG: CheR family methyltransferase [Kofleriaceae bacterium]